LYDKELKPRITNKFRAGDIRHCFADISKIKAKLGYIPNVLVLNEVAFKILMAELSNYSEKFNIWVARKLLKSKEVAEKAYKPVKKYIRYLRGLERLEVVGITPKISFSSVELGERYGLLPSDSFHLATMKDLGIKFIATDDSDFKRVEWAVLVELGVLP
jgi:predicted nucleic acid-binding protein